jgi:hypothetical protein
MNISTSSDDKVDSDALAAATAAQSSPPSFSSPPIKQLIKLCLWAYLIVAPLGLQFGNPTFADNDSAFHARYASIFFSRIFTRTFHTTEYSIWNQRWGDKEFLFHAYLAPFCQGPLVITGAKLAAGLLFAAILCSIAVIRLEGHCCGRRCCRPSRSAGTPGC